jgi:nicotinamide riboside transporter PnuC
MNTADWLQWAGCITGASGALLIGLRLKPEIMRWGFAFFLVSNIFWISYGVGFHVPGLVAQQMVFTLTSMIGIRNWFFPASQSTSN